jgi:hypothetical protein
MLATDRYDSNFGNVELEARRMASAHAAVSVAALAASSSRYEYWGKIYRMSLQAGSASAAASDAAPMV